MNKTKIYTELESGAPNGYVTSINQISGAESIYEPILISAPELRKKAFLGELVPEQRYVIQDYNRLSPAYSEYVSTLGVAPQFLSDFRILVRAVSNSSLSEDAQILCQYEEIRLPKGFDNWKIKYDLWGIKHILSKFNTIETYFGAGGTTDANGDPYTLFYSPETDLAFYQPGNRLASPKFDLPCRISTFCQDMSSPDFNELNTPTPSFSLDEILSSFHAHRGVITYMRDDRSNEAYCDFMNFKILYKFFNYNSAPIIHISPYIAPPEVVDCQNNKIGPYYQDGFLSFPPVMIGPFADNYMGSSTAPMFSCKNNTITNIKGELMLCGSDNIIDHSGGYYYGNNNNISHSIASGSFFNSIIKRISLLDGLDCSESNYSSIMSCQINESTLDNVQMPFAGKSTGLLTFHINGSNLKNSIIIRQTDSTSIQIIRSTVENCDFDVFCDDIDDRGCMDVVIKGISDVDRLILKNCYISRCITLVSHASSVSLNKQVISRSSIVLKLDTPASESVKIVPYESFTNMEISVTHKEFESMRMSSALIPGCHYRITDHTSSNISKIYIGEGIFTATALVRYDLVIKAISSDEYDVNASIAEHQFSEDPSFLDSVTIAPTYIEDYSKYKVTVEYSGATAPSIILAELPNGGPQVPFINTYESIQVSGGTVSNRYTLFVDNIVVPSVYIAYYGGKYFMYDMKRGVIDNVNIPRLIEAYIPGFIISYMQDDHQNEFDFDALNMVLVDSRYNMSYQTFSTSGDLIRTVFCPNLRPYRNRNAYNNKVTIPSIINADLVTRYNKVENVSVIKYASQEFSNNDFVGFRNSRRSEVLQFESGSMGNTFVKTSPELTNKPNITFVSPIQNTNKTYCYSHTTQRFEEEKLVKWSVLKTPANVGDIAYWNGSSVKTVPLSKWKGSLGVPVGVVMIPEGFLPDGRARIISLQRIPLAPWSTLGNIDSITPNYGNVCLTNNVADVSITNGLVGYLPTDRTDISVSPVVCYTDPTCRYPMQGTIDMIPSPYSRNQPSPGYFNTLPGGNALNDFYGLTNTRLLLDVDSDAYLAASLCWNYKDPANSNLQWYLPAMGELAFLMPRFAVIRQSILAVGGTFAPVTLWSSTEWTDNRRNFSMWILYTNGFVTRSEDTYMNYESYPVAII